MRYSGASLIATVLAAVWCGAGSAVAEALHHGGDITCQGPFSHNDTAKSLLAQYKPQARIAEIANLDGESGDSLLLYPDEPRARIEIRDDAGNGEGRVTGVNLKEKRSLWTIEGLKLGMTPKELTAANGGPVTLSGFSQVSESTFAMLGWLPRSGCELVVVFLAPPGVGFDHPLYDKEIKSDDPRLTTLNLTIDELSLNLPPAND
jgi:hypothetical protein